jgi:hypothetical protein
MKRKTLFLFFLCICSSTFTKAQDQLGVRIGYNWFTLHTEDAAYHKVTFTYHNNSIPVSVYFCQRSHLINFYAELGMVNRNFTTDELWQSNVSIIGFTDQASYRISSLWLNLTLAPQFVFGKKIRYFFYPGLYAGILAYSSIDGFTAHYVSDQGSKTEMLTGSAKDWLSPYEVGGLFGFGIDIPVGKNLFITIQNIASVSFNTFSLDTPHHGSYYDDQRMYYRFIQDRLDVGVAYMFRGKAVNSEQ